MILIRAALVVVLLVVAGACASIDHASVPNDWPKLQVIVNEVSATSVVSNCFKYVSPLGKAMLSVPMACAEVSFLTKTCVIYITKNAPAAVMDHELAHCAGADHPGESTLRDAWASYKATR